MKLWFSPIACLFLLLFLKGIVVAQSTTVAENRPNFQDSIYPIDEVTVHAFHYETKLLEIPGAISVISVNKLAENPTQSIAYVLNQVPGVYMQSASLTTNRLTIRGVGSRSPYASNKIRAYYAGIPLTNGVGETTIEDLNQSVLSSVEVIKGPASGFYGAGLGGTLLFDAIHPGQSELSVDYGMASFQTYKTNGELAIKGKNSINLLAFENLDSHGFRKNNQTNRSNYNYIGQFKTGRHEINLIANHINLKAHIPSSIDYETYLHSPEKAASNWAATRGYEDYQKNLFGASLISKWEKGWKSTLVFFGQSRDSKELRPFNLLNENSHYLGERLIAEKTLNTEQGQWKFLLGNESFFEHYDWSTSLNGGDSLLSENLEKRNYVNVFAQIEYLLAKRLHISASANVNQTAYHYTDLFLSDGNQSGDHSFKTIISPRIAVNYSLSTTHKLYAQISHGFSPPSLEETLLPNGGRNPDIQPETGWNYELGSRGYLFDGMYYDVSFYYMHITNQLVSRRVGEDAYLGVNAGKTAHPGLEYYLQSQLPAGLVWKHDLSINGDFTPYYFIDFVDGGNNYSGNELTGTPRYQANFGYQAEFWKQIGFQLHYLMIGRIPLRDDNSIYSSKYGLLNTSIQYKKNWGKIYLKVLAAANNVTDEHYSSMVLINASSFGSRAPRYYYPGTPINFSFKLKLSYLL